MVEDKNKIPTGTFLIGKKYFSQNFVIAFEIYFWPGSGLQNNSRIRIRKKRIRIRNTAVKYLGGRYLGTRVFLCVENVLNVPLSFFTHFFGSQ